MSDGGFHEAQMNNMEMTSVSNGVEGAQRFYYLCLYIY